ncbi:2-amino-4-hydroxy-6-hydroxymethyldihydropteridine diphosphokinase [Gemella cuniculi]|uniref:2-amino-4-hydroxy-6- hydroxymethyldihydropteridine diphosphokinase n=1 Tax=Gemella cuniculi TaxID=150240 RepID=UPI000402C0C9|nr:2-amino-4-hydroxy-6-hydroxymethyldihydropteridine diphosphokinase [Gemella cuniculi]
MIILALGTNIDPKEEYLQKALIQMEKSEIKILKKSSIYETHAWGGVADGKFLNMCVEVKCNFSAYELLDAIQKIELDLGRVRKEHWGNRTIDIDIIEYNNQKFNDERLIIPHKYLHERNFVLRPIYELFGDVIIDNKSIKTSLDKITDEIKVYKVKG